MLVGLVAWATGERLVRRPRTVVRVSLSMLLVVVATLGLAWWLFASRGTLDGYPGDSGLCPANNVPPQWPGWIPA